jgi:hypothetical protein
MCEVTRIIDSRIASDRIEDMPSQMFVRNDGRSWPQSEVEYLLGITNLV